MKSKKTLLLAACLCLALAGQPALWAAPAASGAEARPLAAMPSFAPVAEKAEAAVVNIATVKMVKGRSGGDVFSPFGSPGGDMFDQFFGMPDPRGEHKESSLGSGFIFDPEGYIITNNHVVEGADDITVKLSSGDEIQAGIIGRDPKTDLALIKLKKPGPYPYLALGDSSKVRIGDWVVAIGNPFGLDHTVTSGILSARSRSIGAGPYDDFLQTDASINPGNSGGPLLNLAGEVVGINTAIVAGGTGIGFAIPANLAKGVVEQLKTKGRVVRGWMGVIIQKVTPEMARGLGLESERGALIGDLDPSGPAAAAGLKRRDVVVSFNGQPIIDWQDLPLIVAGAPVGKRVQVVVVRDKREVTVELVVAELKDDAASGPAQAGPIDLGLKLSDLTPQMAGRLGLDKADGVFVAGVAADSPAAEAGIRRNDVILEVDDQAVEDLAGYQALLARKKAGDSVVFLIQRGGNTFFAAMELPQP